MHLQGNVIDSILGGFHDVLGASVVPDQPLHFLPTPKRNVAVSTNGIRIPAPSTFLFQTHLDGYYILAK
jgi:hypothetical protein